MSLFKRISATVTASMDNVVSRVENHDAIIQSSIRECRQAAAKTRVRHAKVQRDGDQLRHQRDKIVGEISLWQNRALESAVTDEQKALQCVKRMQMAEKNHNRIEAALRQHIEVERRIKENLQSLESRLSEIKHQHNTMRSRQSVAEATRIINRLEGDNGHGIEETFDRWESTLVESEIEMDSLATCDPLETEFVQQEETAALKLQLQQLTQSFEDPDNA